MVGTTSRSHGLRNIALIVTAGLVVAFLGYYLIALRVPTASEVEGSWVHAGRGGIQTTLTLSADGTFVISQTPKQVFVAYGTTYWDKDLDWNDLVNLTGTWKVSTFSFGGSPRLEIDIAGQDGQKGYGTYLESSGAGAWRSLCFVYGQADSDNEFVFTRP